MGFSRRRRRIEEKRETVSALTKEKVVLAGCGLLPGEVRWGMMNKWKLKDQSKSGGEFGRNRKVRCPSSRK